MFSGLRSQWIRRSSCTNLSPSRHSCPNHRQHAKPAGLSALLLGMCRSSVWEEGDGLPKARRGFSMPDSAFQDNGDMTLRSLVVGAKRERDGDGGRGGWVEADSSNLLEAGEGEVVLCSRLSVELGEFVEVVPQKLRHNEEVFLRPPPQPPNRPAHNKTCSRGQRALRGKSKAKRSSRRAQRNGEWGRERAHLEVEVIVELE